MKNRRNPWQQISVSQREILTCAYIERDNSSNAGSKKTAGFAQSTVASIAIEAPSQNSLGKILCGVSGVIKRRRMRQLG
jgi:hypothetical protein